MHFQVVFFTTSHAVCAKIILQASTTEYLPVMAVLASSR